jgi:hypothetical protein
VQVPHGEGVANHIVPESCEVIREGIGEALTGERIGQAIEPWERREGRQEVDGASPLR